jgi:hypothetical protein
MSRKFLMIASAIVMVIMGLILIFMPNETLQFLNQEQNDVLALILQLMGALYFGFAILNWMAKNVLIGGIYAKPLSAGNFTHFFIGGLTLIKIAINGNYTVIYIWILTILYIVLAAGFGLVSFSSPKLKAKN